MRSASLLFLFVFIVYSCASLGQQSYASHRVKEGETASKIAAKYNITIYELYKLNPEARGNLYPGLVLILPGGQAEDVTISQDDSFTTHTVKKGETLYSLAKRYQVPEDVIQRYNTQLYANELKTGEKIKIPTQYVSSAESEGTNTSETNRKHIVKPQETKYGLASMYGVTIAKLEEMNPEIKAGLKAGSIINVPDKSYADNAVINEDEFMIYEVKPQETFFSLTRRWNISQEELVKLNPALEDGLKSGMVLKLPKGAGGIDAAEDAIVNKVDLSQRLTNFRTKNIALLLPFNTQKTESDSTDIREQVLGDDRVMRIALDFYSGALMAIDSAKTLGISTNLKVYDTQYQRRDGAATNARKIEQIIRSNNFDQLDAVVGPLTGKNVEKASELLRYKNTPIVSPITGRLTLQENLFQSRPTEDILHKAMLDYIQKMGAGKNIVIVADEKNTSIKNKILSYYPAAQVVNPRQGDNGYYLYANDIDAKITPDKENWVILETNDIPLISNVTTDLSTQLNTNQITLLTTYKGSAYTSDDISNATLMNLNFHFPSVDKTYSSDEPSGFVKSYKSKYGVDPNNYAVRGFDVMFDTLLRLGVGEDLYASASEGYLTEHVENKFNYVINTSGYFNDAVFILKYGDDLILEEVKTPTDVVEFKEIRD